MTPLLTPEQAAKELGISADTLAAMRKAGEIPYINIGRGKKRETPRYDPDDLAAWRERSKKLCQSLSARTGKRKHTISGSTSVVALFRETLAGPTSGKPNR
jgi:excisionase family DNA binding protein